MMFVLLLMFTFLASQICHAEPQARRSPRHLRILGGGHADLTIEGEGLQHLVSDDVYMPWP